MKYVEEPRYKNVAQPSSFWQTVCINTVDGKSPDLSSLSRLAEFTKSQHIGNGKKVPISSRK